MHVRVETAPLGTLHFADGVMVVDVLRATTTATALLERGAASLILAENLASAQTLRQEGELLVGEDGGLTPEAFDIGNSPSVILEQDFSGRTALLATSNGTRAAHLASRSSETVLLACLNNATAACELALHWAEREVAILCAGSGGRESPDDTYVAGLLASRLIGKGASPVGSGVGEALKLYQDQPDPLLLFARVGAYLEPLGLGADLAVCAQLDVSQRVPMLRGRRGSGLMFS